jgi:hypothetical protein
MLLLLLTLAAQTGSAMSAEALKIGTPVAVAELDMGKLKGEPFRLAWSPDTKEIYLQTAELDSVGAVKKARHYVVPAAGGAAKEVEGEPDWAAKYWTWKSWKAAPGSPGFAISVDERREIIKASDARAGGSIAGMGGDSSAGATVGGGGPAGGGQIVLPEGQNANIRTMRLKGEVIGEWVNSVIVPGLTFGWSPAGLNLIAFSAKNEDVVIMDERGHKQKVDTAKITRLPAWSDDGRNWRFSSKKTGRSSYFR